MDKTTNHSARYNLKNQIRISASGINILFFFSALLLMTYLAIRINRNIEESRIREIKKVTAGHYKQ